jgi:hypothetical protein
MQKKSMVYNDIAVGRKIRKHCRRRKKQAEREREKFNM